MNKAPIILFHESLGSVDLWRNFPEKLAIATQREVIAYDRLGFGKSTARHEALDFDFVRQEAKDVLPALLPFLGLKDFMVMGHSVGGGMATICAALYPLQCKALIAESAQSMVEELTLDGIRRAKVAFADEKFLNRLAKYHGDKTQWVLDAWTETWLSPEFVTWDLEAYLTQVHCPLLVIHGVADEYASLAQPKRFVDLAQGETTLCLIEECGHFPHQEKSEPVLRSIQNFLEKID
ncbi:alpha/beta hydrolase [Acinetobacter silvestris]|uniref:Alpha/beta hydrolase n=2 Tax=Acinetobacter silvestris TaxID=1977882 RepID=A0A1Y3CKQ3_9GAMM|nr:alpha/beta hydrolase [Acinetobacter silvestris]